MKTINRIVEELEQQREQIDSALRALRGVRFINDAFSSRRGGRPRKGRKMSAAGRARIAAAQRARWAKQRGRKATATMAGKRGRKPRRMSASARAKIAAAQKARWAKQRQGEKAKATAAS